MQSVRFQDLGNIDYKEAWDYQESLLKANLDIKLAAGRGADARLLPTQHHLLFCEHNHVYTLGKSGNMENLLVNEAQREKLGIAYYHINRGGDITYHGPGQITGYPIFDLEKFRPDIGWYLRNLEEVFIRFLADYGLKGERSEGETGVWLDVGTPRARKICALGVRCSRWVTMHGFAFNVNTDLSYFSHIIPCGITDKAVSSLSSELNRTVPMQEAQAGIKKKFAEIFELDFEVVTN
jgi:lipoyl(octanoyl) transferase